MIDTTQFWIVTILLGVGTFLIRFSFLGLLGDRKLPSWVEQHLKFVGAGVFPAIIVPMLLWPNSKDGQMDPLWIVAACVAMLAGIRAGVIAAILAGMGTLYILEWAF